MPIQDRVRSLPLLVLFAAAPPACVDDGGSAGSETSSETTDETSSETTSETTDPTSGTSGDGSTGTPPDDTDTSGGESVPPSLAGDWSSACFDAGDGTFARLDFALTATDWDLDYGVFGDGACRVPLVTVRIEGPYLLTGPSASVQGAWEGQFSFDTKTITAHADPLVTALERAGCGSRPWAIDEAQSVAEEGCAAFGQYPVDACPADYDLVARDGDTLYFGVRPADNDMCTPERRPTELSPLALALQ